MDSPPRTGSSFRTSNCSGQERLPGERWGRDRHCYVRCGQSSRKHLHSWCSPGRRFVRTSGADNELIDEVRTKRRHEVRRNLAAVNLVIGRQLVPAVVRTQEGPAAGALVALLQVNRPDVVLRKIVLAGENVIASWILCDCEQSVIVVVRVSGSDAC